MAVFSIKTPNLPKFAGRMSQLGRRAETGVILLLSKTAHRAVARVRQLTPRHHSVTAVLWDLKEINRPSSPPGKAGKRAYFAALTHPFMKVGAKHPITKEVVNGVNPATGKDWSLLEGLEYGTQAHLIIPRVYSGGPPRKVKGKKRKGAQPTALRFQIGGRWVSTKVVAHPGTKAYGMVRIAQAEANRDIGAGVTAIYQELLQEWKAMGNE